MIEIRCLASGSSGNAYYITDGQAPLLLEAGIPWRQIQQGLNFRTSELAGILVSHEHQDHAKAVKDAMKAGIDVYASKGTFDALGLMGYRTCVIQATVQFRIKKWVILPLQAEHDAAEPLGFLLYNRGERLLYLTDTAYCRYRFNGLTYIMIECNYSLDILRENVASGAVPVELKNRLLRTHFSLENVKDFLKANDLSRVREIYLLHLSNGNSDAERFKREIQALTGKMVFVADA